MQDARWWQSLWQSGRCHAAGCDLTDLLADWGVSQGEHVLGVRTPHEYLASLTRFVTADVSGQVGADVLLLAGVEDHYVPFRQLGDQLNTLTGARSVTACVFTREEQAQNHIQVGNIASSVRVTLDGLDERDLRSGLLNQDDE